MNLLGGQIELESEMGKGSCFTICFPIRQVRETPALELSEIKEHPITRNCQPIAPSKFIAGKRVLLLIEDHLDIIRYLQKLLSTQFTLITASNGQEGFDKAKQIKPDLIIADIMMPIMDGYELCEQLKKNKLTQLIPIIFLTAKANQEDKLKALRLGIDAFLTKPFNENELLIRINQLLQKRKTMKSTSDFIELPSTQLPIEREAIQFMRVLHQIIEENLTKENFKIKELCTLLNINHSSLNNKIKSITGKPTGKYIRHYRLSIAKQLLETTDLSTKEIAWKVGIVEVSNFSMMFKKAYGVSPRAWRKGKS